mgnify:FL=1
MIWKIKATDPPKPRKSYAVRIAWVLAGVMAVMSVAHLIRIDTLIPVVSQTLPTVAATWFVALIVTAEVFALPYLLRAKLSPLFRMISGSLVVFVPLVWTCFTIWALGDGRSTGQLTSYVSTSATWWLVLLNLTWLGVSYWILWLFNYDESFAQLRHLAAARKEKQK